MRGAYIDKCGLPSLGLKTSRIAKSVACVDTKLTHQLRFIWILRNARLTPPQYRPISRYAWDFIQGILCYIVTSRSHMVGGANER